MSEDLLTRRFIIEKHTPPLCDCSQNLNVSHILNERILFHQYRIKRKISGIAILESEYDFEKIKRFFKEINVYNLI